MQILDQCLRRRQRVWTVTALLEATNQHLEEHGCPQVSLRTLYDDLKYLQETLAAPVEKYQDGKTVCYRYSDPEYTLVNTPLSETEILLLQKMLEYLKANGSPEPLREGIAALLYRHGLMPDIETPKMKVARKISTLEDTREVSASNAPAPSASYQKESRLPEDPIGMLVLRMEDPALAVYRDSFWQWLESGS